MKKLIIIIFVWIFVIIADNYAQSEKDIIKWLYASDEHKIIVIHPNPESLKDEARNAISNKWDSLLNQNKLIIIKQGIEKTSWNQIKTQISANCPFINNINPRNSIFSTRF